MSYEEGEWFREHGATLGIKPPQPRDRPGSGARSMGKNYEKWDAYNVDTEEAETDVEFVREDFERAMKATEDLSKEKIASAGADALELAEIFKAQAAVEALRNSSVHAPITNIDRSKRRRNSKSSGVLKPVMSPSSSAFATSLPKRDESMPAGTSVSDKNIIHSGSISRENAPVVSHDPENVISMLSKTMNRTSITFGELMTDADSLSRQVELSNSSERKQLHETCVQGLVLFQRVDEFLRMTLSKAKALETRVIAAGLKGLPQMRSSMQVLARLEDGAHMIWLKVASKTAVCALRIGRFTVAADITRFWLKAAQNRGGHDALTVSETRKAMTEASTKNATITERTDQHDHKRLKGQVQEQEQGQGDNRVVGPIASMWLLRALSFLGMGCCYIANIHIRQALRLCPSFPGLEKVQSVVDGIECHYMSTLRPAKSKEGVETGYAGTLSTEAYMICRYLRATARHAIRLTTLAMTSNPQHKQRQQQSDDFLSSFDVHKISPALLKQLYDSVDEDVVSSGVIDPLHVSNKRPPVDVGKDKSPISRLHLEDGGIEDDWLNERIPDMDSVTTGLEQVDDGDVDMERYLKVMKVELMNADCRSKYLLLAVHELYYQAQVLFFEGMYRSAFLKYCAGVLFIRIMHSAHPETDLDITQKAKPQPQLLFFNDDNNDGDYHHIVQKYLLNVQASCLLNAASCRAKCQVAHDSYSGNSNSYQTFSFDNKSDLNGARNREYASIQAQVKRAGDLLQERSRGLIDCLVRQEDAIDGFGKTSASTAISTLVSANTMMLCHAGLVAFESKPVGVAHACADERDLMGLLRAAEIAEETHEYDIGLNFLSRACSVLSVDFNLIHTIMYAIRDQPRTEDRESISVQIWRKCLSTRGLSSTSTCSEASQHSAPVDRKDNVEESYSFVARYPVKQCLSQAFLFVAPLEPIAPEMSKNKQMWHQRRSTRSIPIASHEEVIVLLEAICKRRTRLLFKRRRFEGSI